MAAAEGMTTPKFIATLHDEVLDLHGDGRNFTSLLRVVCAVHLGERARQGSPGAIGRSFGLSAVA